MRLVKFLLLTTSGSAIWNTILIVAGYTLGVVLGFGVIGIWLGMCLDWIIRGSFFYWRLASGKWLWKYR